MGTAPEGTATVASRRPVPPIFLANGYAGPDAFPGPALAECAAAVLLEQPEVALQYGPIEGLAPLREMVAGWLCDDGLPATTADDVLIIPGGKQGLSLVARALASPGDTVVTSTPTYMTGLQIFRAIGLRTRGVPTDADGLDVDGLEAVLAQGRRSGSPPALLYTMSDFHNPTGSVMSPQRRRRLAEVAAAADLPVLEDNPYRWMRFEGAAVPPVSAYDEGRQVVSVGSFSKILAPGLRIAWMTAPAAVRERLLAFRLELAASPLTQLVVHRYFETVSLADHLAGTTALYRTKRDTMLSALDASMPDNVAWNRPEGGYYVWLEAEGLDSDTLCRAAAERGVLAYPGSAFVPDAAAGVVSHLRLNYAHETLPRIGEGVGLLADVIRDARRSGYASSE